MSHSCPNLDSTSFLYNPYIPFLISLNFYLLVSFHFFTIGINILSFHNHSKEMGYAEIHNLVTQITRSLKSWDNAE